MKNDVESQDGTPACDSTCLVFKTANSNTFTTVADRGPVSSPIELQSFVDVSVDDMRVDELVATTTRAKLTVPDHDTGGATKIALSHKQKQ